MSNPYESPKWDVNPFRDEAAGLPEPRRPGMVSHVQAVCIFMIVQGVLASLIALMFIGMAVCFPLLIGDAARADEVEGRAGPNEEMMIWVVAGVYGALGLAALTSGLLQIYAGICNLRFRRRTLGFVALIGGLAAVLTCYCAPTSVALAIYGLIVYLDHDVATAFGMGQRGMSRQQVLEAFQLGGPPSFPSH